MMCGLPGSGKTTAAKRLEREHRALRLAPDEWMARVIGDGYDERARAAVEEVQWEIAQRALALGVNVILENGFWTRREREAFRAGATATGAEVELHFLDVSSDDLVRRLAKRNAES